MPNILLGGGPGTATQSLSLQAYIDWNTLNLGQIGGGRLPAADPGHARRHRLRQPRPAAARRSMHRQAVAHAEPVPPPLAARPARRRPSSGPSRCCAAGRSSSCSRSTGWSSPRSRRRTRSTRGRSTSRSSTSSRRSTPGATSWSSSATTRCGRTSTPSSSGSRAPRSRWSSARSRRMHWSASPTGRASGSSGCSSAASPSRSSRWRSAHRSRSRSPAALGVFVILAQTIGRRFKRALGQQRHRVLADLAADPAADRGRRSRCTSCSSRSACSTASSR